MSQCRHSVLWALALLILAWAPVGARADEITPLLPAYGEQFFYFNMRQFVQSPLYKTHLAGPLEREALKDKVVKNFIDKTGINPLRDVERIVVVGKSLAGDDQKALIIVTGTFDAKKLTAAAEDLAAKYKMQVWRDGDTVTSVRVAVAREKGHTFLQISIANGKKKLELAAALADKRRLLLGDRDSVNTALAQAARTEGTGIGKKAVPNALLKMSPTTIFACRLDNSELKKLPGVEDTSTAKLIEKVDMFRLDVRVTNDIKGILTFEMKDSDAAKEMKPAVVKLTNQVKLFIGLIVLNEPKVEPLEGLSKSLKVTTKGKLITVEAALSEEAIKALVKAARETGMRSRPHHTRPHALAAHAADTGPSPNETAGRAPRLPINGGQAGRPFGAVRARPHSRPPGACAG
jgi:hypothetical protein